MTPSPAGDEATSPDPVVVADHDQVVDLGAAAYARRLDGAAVDAGIGPDFHVITHNDCAERSDALDRRLAGRRRFARFGDGEAESIGADAGVIVENHPITNFDPLADPDARVNERIGTDLRAGADGGLTQYGRAGADARARPDLDKWADGRPFADNGCGIDNHAWMNPRGNMGRAGEETGQPGQGIARIVDEDDACQAPRRRAAAPQDRGPGTTGRERCKSLFLHGEGKIHRPRRRRVIHSLYWKLPIAGELAAQRCGDLRELDHQRPRQTGERFSANARAPSK
jgi:hypothetical protein